MEPYLLSAKPRGRRELRILRTYCPTTSLQPLCPSLSRAAAPATPSLVAPARLRRAPASPLPLSGVPTVPWPFYCDATVVPRRPLPSRLCLAPVVPRPRPRHSTMRRCAQCPPDDAIIHLNIVRPSPPCRAPPDRLPGVQPLLHRLIDASPTTNPLHLALTFVTRSSCRVPAPTSAPT